MARVLVALDGSDFASSILPDAIRMAGARGELVLIQDASRPVHDDLDESPEMQAVETSQRYLAGMADKLRSDEVSVRTETFVMTDPAAAIAEAAKLYEVDFVACATHGRSGWQSILHPSISWKALAYSPVPILLHRFSAPVASGTRSWPQQPKILVPLDGSHRAETALPIALRLARDWSGLLVFAHVVPEPVPPVHRKRLDLMHSVVAEEHRNAEAYLLHISQTVDQPVQTAVLFGTVVESLLKVIDDRDFDCVVIASHGRTGFAKTVLGSVAAGLVQRAAVPLVVVPQVASRALGPPPKINTHEAVTAA